MNRTFPFMAGLSTVFATISILAAAAAENKKADDDAVVIHIASADDDTWKYVKQGDDEQKPVTLFVGQTVRWQNDDEDMEHTATSKLKGKDGKRIFDTKKINSKGSKEIVFNEALFKSAGGQPGGEVKLEYYCSFHPRQMSSVIVLKSANQETKSQ